MNVTAGFALVDGRMVNIDPLAAMATPAAFPQTLHMTLAAYAATGFVVAGIHAFRLLRHPADRFRRAGGDAATRDLDPRGRPALLLPSLFYLFRVFEGAPAAFERMER